MWRRACGKRCPDRVEIPRSPHRAGGRRHVGAAPAGPYLEYAILSDFIFSVVLFAVAVVLGRVLLDTPPRLRGLIAVGALCAVAAYMRPSGQFLVLAPLLATPLVTKSRREP